MPQEEMVFRRRRLPHQDVEGHPVFITACLDGSIQAAGWKGISRFRDELAQRPKPRLEMSDAEWEMLKHKLLFQFVDNLLDRPTPVQHLADPRQAKIVQNAFLHFAGQRYQLLAFVVMPSHHHWLFLPDPDWSAEAVAKQTPGTTKQLTAREIISHSIQSYTGTMCNRIRDSAGQYWQHETFDHWARDEADTIRIIRYIENNPLKAGLSRRPEDYLFSSANYRNIHRLEPYSPITKVA